MTTNLVIMRNDVLQYGMDHRHELNNVLHLTKPFSIGRIEVYGCNTNGDLLGLDEDETEVNVSYSDIGTHKFFEVFDDLYNKYCSS